MFTKRLTSMESFSSWIAGTWALALVNPSSYYNDYPALFSSISILVSETTLTYLTASYFLVTIVLFETEYWKTVSFIHFVTYTGAAFLFLHGDYKSQIGFAYLVIAVFNIINWYRYSYEKTTERHKS